MKKKLLPIIFMLSTLSAYAQQLANSTWAVKDTMGKQTAYCHFSADTLSISSNNTNYSPNSVFWQKENTFTLVDLRGTCSATDTGRYTFLIRNDTLRFTVIADPCNSRIEGLTQYYLVRTTAGFKDIPSPLAIRVFPNPSVDGIFNVVLPQTIWSAAKIAVVNAVGATVFQEDLPPYTINHTISLDYLPTGIYFLTLQNGKTSQTIKIVK